MEEKVIVENRQGEGIEPSILEQNEKLFYIESYGCQMNFNDSEIVASILQTEGYKSTRNCVEADLILLNTCSIREKAEDTIRHRLKALKGVKKHNKHALIGILGCMAERLKTQLLEEEKMVDLVVGPDAYRTLPDLIKEAETGQKAVNVLLSREETYDDISPIRLDEKGISAYVSIMRGCNNMCAFCVVPFTRGRERSREVNSILREVQQVFDMGYREVTLLGQNVDSYHWNDENESVSFAQLLEKTALISPLLRVKFSTSHPKDITDEVLFTIAKYDNICNYIHLPVQSGSTRILQLMNRTYTREWYLKKVERIREIIPNCAISSDIITGFCTETEEDHQDTLSIIKLSQYDLSYMYFYSERPGTLAQRRFEDNVPLEVKKRRLDEVITVQRQISYNKYQKLIGQEFEVLLEGPNKKDTQKWMGRTAQNHVVIFPMEGYQLTKCEYITVKITSCTSATLFGEIVKK